MHMTYVLMAMRVFVQPCAAEIVQIVGTAASVLVLIRIGQSPQSLVALRLDGWRSDTNSYGISRRQRSTDTSTERSVAFRFGNSPVHDDVSHKRNRSDEPEPDVIFDYDSTHSLCTTQQL